MCKAAQKAMKRLEYGRLATLFLSLLRTEKLSGREKQDGTEKRDQHPSCICLGNYRDTSVSTFICIVIARSVFVLIALVPFSAIVVGIRQRWENHTSVY